MSTSFEKKNTDFFIYEHLPFPVLVTQEWKILYYNSLAENLFGVVLKDKEFTDFLSKEQQNFVKFQIQTIPNNQILTFSILLSTGSKSIPLLLHLKALKDELQKCYFIIILQQINQISEKLNILSKIVLETFTIYGENLYKELLDRITKYYSLEGAIILVYNKKNQTQKILEYSSYVDILPYKLSEKLLRRIQKYGSIIVSKDFKEYYPEDKLSMVGVQSLVAIKVQVSEIEDIILFTFSLKEISDPGTLHLELNIINVKIISEYLRINQNLKIKRIYKTFLDTNDAIVIYHIDSDSIIDYNPAFTKLLGYSDEEIKNKSIFDLTNFPFLEKYKKTFFYYYKKNRLKNSKFRFKIKNKNDFEIPVEVAFNFIKENENSLLICIIRDLTFATHAIEEHKKYIQTLSLLNLQVVELNEKLEIIFTNHIKNSKFKKIIVGMNFLDIILPDFRDYVKIILENLFKKKDKNIRIRFPIRIYGTRNDWIEGDFVLVKNQHKKLIRGILKDITLEYLAEKQCLLLAETDLLTSLPNRNRLEEDLQKAILRADKNHTLVAVGFLDLDKFYNVNEFLGHRMGDLVLTLFAERLILLPEISYSTYRWGGDQFVFFIDNIKSKGELIPFTEKLKQLTKEPFLLEGEKFFLTFSAGIALYPSDGTTIDTLFGEADKAMNYAKHSGRFQIIFADSLPKKDFPLSKLEIQSYILQSISEKKINIYYQPIYDSINKKVIGTEALARLNRFRDNIYIGPDIFIPIAEDLGIIEELSYYIMYMSFKFMKKFIKDFDIYLSINISRRLLQSDYFLMNLFDIQNQVGIDASKVALEITETLAMMDKETNLKKIQHLKKMGYKIAIDDFGTGYSSLGLLQDFPVDIIKIDKIFLKKLKKEENNKILEAIVHMAMALNVAIVAEGVEDYTTVELLNKLGISFIQGFFFSPPLNPSDLEKKFYDDFKQNLSYLI